MKKITNYCYNVKNKTFTIFSVKSIFFLIIAFSIFNCEAQKINDVKIIKNADFIELELNFSDCKTGQVFIPSAEFYYHNGSKIPAQNITLKSGKTQITCGSSDILQWNIKQDAITINQEVYAKVKLKPQLKINKLKHLTKSVIFPGWGDYKLRNGKLHFTYGILEYGLVATSIILQQNAIKNYNNYKENDRSVSESDNFFKKAILQRNISYALLASATVIWTVDLASIFTKSKKIKNNLTPEQSNYYYQLANTGIEAQSKSILIDNRSEYEIAIDNGTDFLKKADNKITESETDALSLYITAKNYFEKALNYKANDTKAQAEIALINKHISNIEARKSKFNSAITKADSLLTAMKLDESESFYNQAKHIYPKEPRPQKGLDEIQKLRETQRIQAEYNQLIAQADEYFAKGDLENAKTAYKSASNKKPHELKPQKRIAEIDNKIAENNFNQKMKDGNSAFAQKNYEQAKSFYNDALNYKANAAEANNKIAECNKKLADIEQARIDKEYKDALTKADVAYNNKEYDKAKALYQIASDLKPSESYPKVRINSINDYLEQKKIIVNNGDLTSIYENCKPAVLFIFDMEYNYFKADFDAVPIATGFFFTSDGYGITNYHVYKDLHTTGIVYSGDGEVYEIEKWYNMNSDDDFDYAIFKVKLNSYQTVKSLTISNSGCKEGQKVCIIGNPNGIKFSIKDGLISSFITENTIEHSVPTEGGSSGSPVLNMNGEVIGLHKAGLKGKGNNNLATDIRKIPTSKYK